MVSILLSLLGLPVFLGYSDFDEVSRSQTRLSSSFADQIGPRVLVPVYVRLQVLEKANLTLWESVPKNFSDHVATIDSRVLAMFIPSNSLGFNLSRDSLGNLWMVTTYSLNAGDYVSTLAWVSAKTLDLNLTSLGFVPFPSNYRDDVKVFLQPGRKISSDNETIIDIAVTYNQTENKNMTRTAENILEFVNRQGYDRETTRLLLSGDLVTSDILDFFKDSLRVHDTNVSICLERSWYAAAILRAAGVPTRTVTDVRLKTWVQVWLPNLGWIDAETLCTEPASHASILPKPISAAVPWLVQNSSDAMFPFTWSPHVPMRVANLTFGGVSLFRVDEYKTVMSQPIDVELFREDPNKFSFPIRFEPETINAAVTQEGSGVVFSLIKEDENVSRTITIDEYNSVSLGGLTVSFIPAWQDSFLVLYDFSVRETWSFDVWLVFPIVGVPVAVLAVWLYWRRRR